MVFSNCIERLFINLFINLSTFFTFHSLSFKGVHCLRSSRHALTQRRAHSMHTNGTSFTKDSRTLADQQRHEGGTPIWHIWGGGGRGEQRLGPVTDTTSNPSPSPHPFPHHILRARPQPHYYVMCVNRVAPAAGHHTCFARVPRPCLRAPSPFV